MGLYQQRIGNATGLCQRCLEFLKLCGVCGKQLRLRGLVVRVESVALLMIDGPKLFQRFGRLFVRRRNGQAVRLSLLLAGEGHHLVERAFLLRGLRRGIEGGGVFRVK